MKIRASFGHVFEVTREVTIDDEQFADWLEHERKRQGRDYPTREAALEAYLYDNDEIVKEVFPDFRDDQPVPKDFEYQYYRVNDTEQIVEETT